MTNISPETITRYDLFFAAVLAGLLARNTVHDDEVVIRARLLADQLVSNDKAEGR